MKQIRLLIFLLLTAHYLYAQDNKVNFQIQTDLEQISLWTVNMPDGKGSREAEKINTKGSVTNVSNPRLIIHKPGNPNGTAILIISGGGYAHIELGKESTPTANWLQSEGVTAFELIYRLPQEGWKTTSVPFEDAQRAIRIIRSRANSFGIDPNKIGVLGFSAGGHLAGFVSAQPEKQFYTPIDKIDSLSAKPNFTGLIYPVLSMLPPNNKTHTKKSILGENPTMEQEIEFSVEQQVNNNMPETFLAQALDDPISPIDNIFLMSNALRKANVPFEMQVFQSGGHGWGMGKSGSLVIAWSGLFKNWAKFNGFWK
ncbi:MAG: alpha/beta hydrolase [Flavobacterium sp.]|nr:alpha/beta hydrolase [Flavobacterium sp.]